MSRLQEPCPGRIIDQTGAGFGMGCIGSFFFTLNSERKNFPKGERWSGALFRAKQRCLQTGSNFAHWAMLFTTFDCAFAGIVEEKIGEQNFRVLSEMRIFRQNYGGDFLDFE